MRCIVISALFALLSISGQAYAEGVAILITRDTFTCRDLSDTVRLGLHMLDGNKGAFLTFYADRQKAGACQPLRKGTIAALIDSHDEQGLHMACIKQAGDGTCFWALNPSFGPAP